jgi:hypothetical protein
MAAESFKYEIFNKESDFESRKYAPHIVTETIVDANLDKASDIKFHRLAAYIFGVNTSKQKIAMTEPAGQELRKRRFVTRFNLPSEDKFESLPIPNDETAILKSIGERKIAAVSFSGTLRQ